MGLVISGSQVHSQGVVVIYLGEFAKSDFMIDVACPLGWSLIL